MSDVLILIPAAGASSRMRGRDKLLEEIDGEPLLRRTTLRALASGANVLVTCSADHPGRIAILDALSHPALIRTPPVDATEGIAASIRQGAQTALSLAEVPVGLMILLADLPDLTTADIANTRAAFSRSPDRVHRATSDDGTPGHPVIFPRRLFGRLAKVTGDNGARSVLKGEHVEPVPLPGNHAISDLDTPEDWAAWRAAREIAGP